MSTVKRTPFHLSYVQMARALVMFKEIIRDDCRELSVYQRLIDIPGRSASEVYARRDVDYLDYSGVFDEWFHLELRSSGKVGAVSSPVWRVERTGHGPRVSKAKVGLYLRNIAFNAGSLRKCRGGVANLYDGIQFIPVNYSAFSLDFLSPFANLRAYCTGAIRKILPPLSPPRYLPLFVLPRLCV